MKSKRDIPVPYEGHTPLNSVTVMLPATPPEPMLEHATRCRAYELYVQRGMAHGHDVDDWLKAEAELVHGHSTSDSNWPKG